MSLVVATLATRPTLPPGGKAYRHRKLELIRSQLPVGCTREEAFQFVMGWNAKMGEKAMGVLISNIVGVFRHPRVEAQWNKIAALVEADKRADPSIRYEERFRLIAVQVRNGRRL